MTVQNVVTSFNGNCRHCGELWCIGADYHRMKAQLPNPSRAGKYKVPCPYCGKKNTVTVEVRPT